MLYWYCQVLTDNAANCRKLSEEELRQIFQLATSSVNPDHFELCVTLQAAIKVLINWLIVKSKFCKSIFHLYGLLCIFVIVPSDIDVPFCLNRWAKLLPSWSAQIRSLLLSCLKSILLMFSHSKMWVGCSLWTSALCLMLMLSSSIWSQPNQESETSQTLLMNAIDLLSVCAESGGESARNYAHRLYSIEDLLRLVNKLISPDLEWLTNVLCSLFPYPIASSSTKIFHCPTASPTPTSWLKLSLMIG